MGEDRGLSAAICSLRENSAEVVRRTVMLSFVALSLTASAHALHPAFSPTDSSPDAPVRLKLWPDQWADAIRDFVITPASWNAETFESVSNPQ